MSGATRPGAPITQRDVQVLRLMANGYTAGSIATRLDITESTARTHARRIFTKLGANDRTSAVALAFAGGILKPADITINQSADAACSGSAMPGAVQRLLVMWRRMEPPANPTVRALWWVSRLDELSNAIRKDASQ